MGVPKSQRRPGFITAINPSSLCCNNFCQPLLSHGCNNIISHFLILMANLQGLQDKMALIIASLEVGELKLRGFLSDLLGPSPPKHQRREQPSL